jgi:hypothetical protein
LSCVDAEEPLRPSWVPDWNTPRVTDALGYSTKAWGVYMAGGAKVVDRSQKILVTLSEDKKRITIRGKLFDKIAHIGAASKDPDFCVDAANLATNTWASSNATYSAANDSVYSAFFQTLMAGRDGTGTGLLSPNHSEVFGLILDETIHHQDCQSTDHTSCPPKLSLPGQTHSARRKKGFFKLESLVAGKGKKVRKPVQVLEDMRVALRAALHMRRFAVTRRGYFALIPRGAREGDEVVVFEKCCVPFLIRRAQESGVDGEVFELVGETYVYGIMKGEAMEVLDLPLKDVTLV